VIRRRVIVHGLVQGVWFRESTRLQAVHHDVAGWVRNRPDGTVEAVFEGDAAAVERLVAWAGKGPRGAIVARIEVGREQPVGETGFEVR
jgi:acylphosphatase